MHKWYDTVFGSGYERDRNPFSLVNPWRVEQDDITTSLPERVRLLKWLENLDIQANSIYKLPGWIGELTDLQSLVL